MQQKTAAGVSVALLLTGLSVLRAAAEPGAGGGGATPGDADAGMGDTSWPRFLDIALDHLTLGRALLQAHLQDGSTALADATAHLHQAVDGLRQAGHRITYPVASWRGRNCIGCRVTSPRPGATSTRR